MLKLDGYARIRGTAPPATTACPAGGSILTQKVGSTFSLTASNCRLLTTDGLVYDGVWIITIGQNSYAADGSCVGSCLLTGGIDHSAARFGYGVADTFVFGAQIQFQSAGSPSPSISAIAENFPGELNVSVLGGVQGDDSSATANIALGRSGTLFFKVDSTDDRRTLLLSGTLRARVTIGAAGLSAVVDKDGDGVFEKALDVPWARFL